jgi:ABC-type uncharacterized transport system permease subunit
MAAYALAAALYLGYLTGASFQERLAQWGRVALGVGVGLQFVDIGVRCYHLQNPLSSTPDAVAFVAFMIAAGYLGAASRYRLAAAGAFAVPAVLILLLLARVVPADTGAMTMGALGRTHIFLATLGVAIFTLAAILAVLYLVEDRQLKKKQFGMLIRRGAPLATLDRLALRCVSFGFPVFTVALITGAVWIARLGGMERASVVVRPEYVLAVATWLAFGILLVARVGAGWQGRRAAWLTLGGFGGAMLVLGVYFIRHAV